MFRDPSFYKEFRERVIPLSGRTILRIWHAGCSTARKCFSMAIFSRRRVYDRRGCTRRTSTTSCCSGARQGIFPLDRMQEYTENYMRAGAGGRSRSITRRSTTGRCSRHRSRATSCSRSTHSSPTGRQRVPRDLLSQLLIYFDKALQNRVHSCSTTPRDVRHPRAWSKESLNSRSTSRATRAEPPGEALPEGRVMATHRAWGTISLWWARLGGLAALRTLVAGLPDSFQMAVALVQHRQRIRDHLLRTLLQDTRRGRARWRTRCRRAGRIYVAPGLPHPRRAGPLRVDARMRRAVQPAVDRRDVSVPRRTATPPYRGHRAHGGQRRRSGRARRISDRGGMALVQDPDSARAACAIGGAPRRAARASHVARRNQSRI